MMPTYSRWLRRLGWSLTLTALLAVTASVAHTQGTRVITGVVRDTAGVPIPYASIRLDSRLVATDDSGRFRLQVDPAKRFTVQIRRIGFVPTDLRVEPGADTTVALAMIPASQSLPGTKVTVTSSHRALELSGFYRRLREKESGINAGHFITMEDIEHRKPPRVTHLIDGLGGVRMQRVISKVGRDGRLEGPDNCLRQDPDCIAPTGPNNCAITVYLNGTRLNPLRGPTQDGVGGLSWATGIDALVGWSAVAGIEIYSSAGRVPPEYQRLGGTCGAILIWTK